VILGNIGVICYIGAILGEIWQYWGNIEAILGDIGVILGNIGAILGDIGVPFKNVLFCVQLYLTWRIKSLC
jgi:hypothetical protein